MMKIDIQGSVPLDKVSTEQKPNEPNKGTTPSSETTKQLSNTQLSEISKIAQQTFDTLSTRSDVDMQKVQQIQTAIEKGELHLDEDVLLKTLLDMHR